MRALDVGDRVELKRDPVNAYDKNAVAVFNTRGHKLGYIPAQVAVDLARSLDEDAGNVSARVIEKIAPNSEYRSFNALLEVYLVRNRRKRVGRSAAKAVR